ncbi:MAG: hypothetical protein V4719_10045 [Planctomycetota bacterium]
MTIYIHNPPEPDGTPSQPIVDITRFFLGGTASGIQGRCGFCSCVPKVWRLDLKQPDAEHGSFSEYAGVYYLRKVRYGIELADSLCAWISVPGETLPGVNPITHGWLMCWEPFVSDQPLEGYGWSIYSPVLQFGNEVIPERRGSRWLYNGDQFNSFKCLSPNQFVLRAPDPDFPFNPQFINISPYFP